LFVIDHALQRRFQSAAFVDLPAAACVPLMNERGAMNAGDPQRRQRAIDAFHL